jgi:hypothetical protein
MESLLAELARPPSNKGARIALLAGGLAILAGGAVAGAYVLKSHSDKAPVVARPVVVDAGHRADEPPAAAQAEQRATDGDAAFAKGDLAAAMAAFEEARTGFEGADDRPKMIAMMQRLGDVDVELGKLAEGAQLYVTAGELHQKDGRAPDAAAAWGRAADARVRQGQLADAEALLAKATPLAGEDATAKAQLDLAAAQLAFARGDLATATEHAKRCEALVACALLAGDVLAARAGTDKERAAAADAYDHALELADGNVPRKQAIQLAYAELELDAARFAEADRDAATDPTAKQQADRIVEEQRASANERVGEVLAAAKVRGNQALIAHATLVRAQLRLATAASEDALQLLTSLQLDAFTDFRVRTRYLMTLGKAKVFAEGADIDADPVSADGNLADAGGFAVIQLAAQTAEQAGWKPLALEARLARVEAQRPTNPDAAKLDARGLYDDALHAGLGRIAALAKL